MNAFAATLEELKDADLLLHVVDASSHRMEEQIMTVEMILKKLDLHHLPALLVLNKCDRLEGDEVDQHIKRWKGIPITALDPGTFSGLLSEIEAAIWPHFSSRSISTGYHPERERDIRNGGGS